MFRTFFSKNRLLGGSSTPAHPYNSHPYGDLSGANGRKRNRDGIEELALTSAAAKGVGVTTVIESMGRGRTMAEGGGQNVSGKVVAGPLDTIDGWGGGDRKVSDVSSEEEMGWQSRTILKTTASSQVRS